MAASDAAGVQTALLAAGLPARTPVAVAESVSSAQSALHAGTLADLPDLAARLRGGPALLLVGELFVALQAIAARDLARRSASQSA